MIAFCLELLREDGSPYASPKYALDSAGYRKIFSCREAVGRYIEDMAGYHQQTLIGEFFSGSRQSKTTVWEVWQASRFRVIGYCLPRRGEWIVKHHLTRNGKEN